MTVKTARNALSLAWGAGSFPLLILVSIQTMTHRYGAGLEWDKGMLWIFPLVLPVLGMIGGAISVGENASDNLPLSSVNSFWFTLVLIIVYFIILYSSMLIGFHIVGDMTDAKEASDEWTFIISSSSWILGTLQWVITIALTKFFIENIRPQSADSLSRLRGRQRSSTPDKPGKPAA
jgi:hypothetical protein